MASLLWLRVLICIYVTYLNIERLGEFAASTLAMLLTATMLGWTAVVSATYWRLVAADSDPSFPPGTALRPGWRPAHHQRRLNAILAVDLTVSVAIVLASLVTHSTAMRLSHEPTVASYWLCLAPLTIAVLRGPWWGLAAAAVASASDVTTRLNPTADIVRTLVLLCVACVVVGITAATMRNLFFARLEAERAAAALRERERLARTVHDGVIQVLALTQRAASRNPGNKDFTDLAAEAAVQEAALRALIHSGAREQVAQRAFDKPHPMSAIAGAANSASEAGVDLTTELEAMAGPGHQVSTPGYPVEVPRAVAEELLAAVAELLRNCDKHAPGAQRWILLEDENEAVRVTVRDNGPGIAEGRLEAALAQGHLGVSGSVRGRLADLGGQALLHTDDDGTEWELVCPRRRTSTTDTGPSGPVSR